MKNNYHERLKFGTLQYLYIGCFDYRVTHCEGMRNCEGGLFSNILLKKLCRFFKILYVQVSRIKNLDLKIQEIQITLPLRHKK